MATRRGRHRTYGEFCGVARALDVVGDRWTLLVVRELLVGPARYAELLSRLPGIATNLLADRLRDLEAAGILERRDETWGSAYSLTARGADLEETIHALVRWSTPLMATGRGTDEFRPSWLAVALRALLAPARATHTIGLVVDDEPMTLTTGAGQVEVTPGAPRHPAATIDAPAEVLLGIASGTLPFGTATKRRDVRVHGSNAALRASLVSNTTR